jgi:hypothetical protein
MEIGIGDGTTRRGLAPKLLTTDKLGAQPLAAIHGLFRSADVISAISSDRYLANEVEGVRRDT